MEKRLFPPTQRGPTLFAVTHPSIHLFFKQLFFCIELHRGKSTESSQNYPTFQVKHLVFLASRGALLDPRLCSPRFQVFGWSPKSLPSSVYFWVNEERRGAELGSRQIRHLYFPRFLLISQVSTLLIFFWGVNEESRGALSWLRLTQTKHFYCPRFFFDSQTLNFSHFFSPISVQFEVWGSFAL